MAPKARGKAAAGKASAKRKREETEDAVEDQSPSKRTTRASAAAEAEEAAESANARDASKGASGAPKHTWEQEGTMLYVDYPSYKPSTEIVAFDMDGTIVNPKSGRVHPQSRSDWKWLLDEVVPTLKKLHSEGKTIAIFTNQGGIGGAHKAAWDQHKADSITGKISDLADALGVPLLAYIATSEDIWRKPQTAMWDFFVKHTNKGVQPDLSKCIYVGDAAGRAANWKPGAKKDFSCSDRKFAKNVGIDFKTPEEFFLNEKAAPFEWGGYEANSKSMPTQITEDNRTSFHSPSQEVVVFCGFPASGKSTFAKRHLIPHGYVHVNRDTLKTPKACFDTAQKALAAGKSVVVDNTMPHYKSDDNNNCNGRKAYIDLAAKHKVPCRLFHFQTTEEMAKHLNMYRERLTDGVEKHVSRIGYNMYKSKYEEPKASEGYAEIVKINFVPQFADKRAEDLFHQSA